MARLTRGCTPRGVCVTFTFAVTWFMHEGPDAFGHKQPSLCSCVMHSPYLHTPLFSSRVLLMKFVFSGVMDYASQTETCSDSQRRQLAFLLKKKAPSCLHGTACVCVCVC